MPGVIRAFLQCCIWNGSPSSNPADNLLVSRARDLDSERALNRFHPITFDHVADAHVLEILERHAAFLAGGDFSGIVLEALELRELAFVHDHIVADQPHIGAALDRAVGDAAAGDLADLRDVEDFEDLRVAEHGFAPLGVSRPDIAFFTSSTRS